MTQRTILITFTVGVFSCTALLAQGPGRGFGGFGPRGEGLLGAGPGLHTVVTGEPYSGTETLSRQEALTNGTQISSSSSTLVYRDTQGRIATVRTITPPASSGKAAFTETTIFDPVAGYSYSLNSSTMKALQFTLPKPRTSSSSTPRTPPTRPSNPNIVTTSLGTQTINGVSATGTEVTNTIPAGTFGNSAAIVSTRISWISTALGVPVSIKTNDPRFGTSDMELTGIVQGEPSATVFTVPSTYTIVPEHGRGGGPGGPGGPGGQARGRRGPQ
jgi:hypothetical protein